MKRNRWSERFTSALLAAAMTAGICSTATLAADLPKLIEVPQDIDVSVPYATSEEKAKTSLPATVQVQVEDLTPLAEVETLHFNFEDGAVPQGLTLLSDKIKVQDAKLNFANDTNVKAVAGDESLTDYVVEVDLQCTEQTPAADYGVMFRTTQATADGPDSYHGLYVGLGVLDFNAEPIKYGLKVGYADGGWHDIQSYEYSLDAAAVNTLKVVVYKDSYTVFLKKPEGEYEKILSATQNLFAQGSAGLRSYKQSFSADNFTVRAVTEQDLADCGIVRSVAADAQVQEWTCENYDPSTPGSYTFVGALAPSADFANPENLTAKAAVTVREKPSVVAVDHSVPFSQVTVTDDFWFARQKQFVCEVIPTCIARVSVGGGGMPNFKAASEYLAGKEGAYTTSDAPAHRGAKYVDSDVYKLVESMAYALQLDARGDAQMIASQRQIRDTLEMWIPWFVGSQEADGYLYTSYTLNSGEIPASQMRFTGRRDDMPVNPDGVYDTVGTSEYNQNADFDDHELYCVGHFYEAAVAHYRATGDFRLLDVAVKNADLVAKTFGLEEGKVRAVPGHQEIELALIKLAAVCGEIGVHNGVDYASKADRYIAVAKYFLDDRGGFAQGLHDGFNSSAGWQNFQYSQTHKNPADQTEAVGHCVRAQYMYTGMADVALMELAAGRENPYHSALLSLWDDVTNKKQYVTGGVGLPDGEAFGDAYELPNGGAYCETCAQISNAMWNQRMNLLYDDSKYADVIENNLYNSIISCVNLDGNQFFYGNPMQSDNGGLRSDWFGTACCPPNLMRTVCSIGGYIYTQDANGDIALNQYIGSTAELNVNGSLVKLALDTEMPWYGNSTLTVTADAGNTFAIRLRVPSWANGENVITLNGEAISAQADENGYVEISRAWNTGDTVAIHFPMQPERVYSDENVVTNKGLTAVRRGPILYAAEQVDNTLDVARVELATDAELKVGEMTRLPGREGEDRYGVENYLPLTARVVEDNPFGEDTANDLALVPYFMWGNRGKTVMRVYLKEPAVGEKPLEHYADATASFTCKGDSPSRMNDGSTNTSDSSHDRWTAYGSPNTQDWVQYEFAGDVRLRGCYVMWYDDGGGVQAPTGLTVQYWDGSSWKDVQGLSGTDKFPGNGPSKQEGEQLYSFNEVVTTKIRLYPTNPATTSQFAQPGIIEWRLDGEIASPKPTPTPAPTSEPTPAPTSEPTPAPTSEPTPAPTSIPVPAPDSTAQPAEQQLPQTGDTCAVFLLAGLALASIGAAAVLCIKKQKHSN